MKQLKKPKIYFDDGWGTFSCKPENYKDVQEMLIKGMNETTDKKRQYVRYESLFGDILYLISPNLWKFFNQ